MSRAFFLSQAIWIVKGEWCTCSHDFLNVAVSYKEVNRDIALKHLARYFRMKLKHETTGTGFKFILE